jgi:hypothetical protein
MMIADDKDLESFSNHKNPERHVKRKQVRLAKEKKDVQVCPTI